MKYLSICSGIEAASVAFDSLGWTPLAFSEIEPFPRAVLAHHYPDTPLHGDFTELRHEPWIADADLLCGGTPCQAFSVAGNRQSLDDDRGNLTLQFVLLANAIDTLRLTAGREPAWILWENVPGVTSTHDNAFGSFLGGLAGNDGAIEPGPRPEPGKSSAFWRWAKDKHIPKWPSAGVVDGPARCVAWRTLDAQHFGLAQRRKRVFVLARGGAGRWAVADALLPIIESREWHTAPRRSSGKGVAPTISARTSGGGGLGTDFDLDGGLIEVLAIRNSGRDSDMREGRNGTTMQADTMFTLQAQQQHSVAYPIQECSEPPMLVRMREGKEGGGKGPLVSEDQSLTLATANDQVLAYRIHGEHSTAMTGNGVARVADPAEVARCLDTCGGYSTNQGGNVVQQSMRVRRLTPVECARLQGFPDDYLDIIFRGKPAADGNKYKALGNSWAVPCARYIGERIVAVTKERP